MTIYIILMLTHSVALRYIYIDIYFVITYHLACHFEFDDFLLVLGHVSFFLSFSFEKSQGCVIF